MSNSQHTTAWKIDEAEDLPLAVIEDTEEGEGICEIGERNEINLQRARLIAAALELLTAAEAAIAYDEAIQSCDNSPEKMATFCTAQGDSLDRLYDRWICLSRAAIAKAKGQS
jgi:hypothetical protein